MSGQFQLDGYNDVPSRIAEFREKHPEGSLQPADPAVPYRIEQIADQVYISVVAAAFRSPDDSRPGIGMAYEVFPGKTPYTRGSELQNAETSAWGRAIVAALAADTRKGIASAEEVRNRQAERVPEEQEPDERTALQHRIKDKSVELGWTPQQVIEDFAQRTKGKDIREGSVDELTAYLTWFADQPDKWETKPAGDPT